MLVSEKKREIEIEIQLLPMPLPLLGLVAAGRISRCISRSCRRKLAKADRRQHILSPCGLCQRVVGDSNIDGRLGIPVAWNSNSMLLRRSSFVTLRA